MLRLIVALIKKKKKKKRERTTTEYGYCYSHCSKHRLYLQPTDLWAPQASR